MLSITNKRINNIDNYKIYSAQKKKWNINEILENLNVKYIRYVQKVIAEEYLHFNILKSFTRSNYFYNLKYIRVNSENDEIDLKDKDLPDTLQTLILKCDITPSSLKYIPNNVAKLVFNENFNEELNFLPENLEYLGFGYFDKKYTIPYKSKFNKKLPILPKLKTLVLGDGPSAFNNQIDKGVLQNGLENLVIGYNYTRNLYNKIVPKTVRHFTCGYTNNLFENDCLPKNLYRLHLFACDGYDFKELKNTYIPENIQQLYIDGTYSELLIGSGFFLRFKTLLKLELRSNTNETFQFTINPKLPKSLKMFCVDGRIYNAINKKFVKKNTSIIHMFKTKK